MILTKSRGTPVVRRSASERIALLAEKKRLIEAELASLTAREREAERKRDTRRKIIIGAAVLAHTEIDPQFIVTLRHVLNRAVQRPADRETIADLLRGEDETPEAAAQPRSQPPARQDQSASL
jgi:hypothetical protein